MLSNRPYLLRAFYQWIADSGCTPILVIDATQPRCKIPMEYVEGGEIVFNISPTAVRDIKMGNELIEFKASFSGVIHIIAAPIKAVLAIYAEENGEGLFFDAEEEVSGSSVITPLKGIEGSSNAPLDPNLPSSGEAIIPPPKKNKPILKLIE